MHVNNYSLVSSSLEPIGSDTSRSRSLRYSVCVGRVRSISRSLKLSSLTILSQGRCNRARTWGGTYVHIGGRKSKNGLNESTYTLDASALRSHRAYARIFLHMILCTVGSRFKIYLYFTKK